MATRKTAKKKRSPAEIKRLIAVIDAEIEKQQSAAAKNRIVFISSTRAQLEAKLQRAQSPFIVAVGGQTPVPAGGTSTCSITIFNPDLPDAVNLAAALFVGNANAITSNDLFLSAFDARFATLAIGAPFGFQIPSHQFLTVSFPLPIPLGVAKTGYFINFAVQQLDAFGTGILFDRAGFIISVV